MCMEAMESTMAIYLLPSLRFSWWHSVMGDNGKRARHKDGSVFSR